MYLTWKVGKGFTGEVAFEKGFDRAGRMGVSSWDPPRQRPRGLEVLGVFCSLVGGVGMGWR